HTVALLESLEHRDINCNDPFRSALLIELKEINKGHPAPAFRKLCWEEFTRVFRLLSSSATIKREQDRVKLIRVNAFHVPASIKVIGAPLGRDKAPVNVGAVTSCSIAGRRQSAWVSSKS